MTTNRQGMLAEHFVKNAARTREHAAAADAYVRNWAAQKAQTQGRSPQKDAMQAQLNLLRQFGVGV